MAADPRVSPVLALSLLPLAGPASVVPSALANASATTVRAPATKPDANHSPIAAVVLRVEGVEPGALSDAVRLRSPKRELSDSAREAAGQGRRFAFVDGRVEASGEVTLSIVLSDGNAYFRTVAAPQPDQSPDQLAADRIRLVASTLSSLLAAVEEERVEPDAVDVPIPKDEQVDPDPVAPGPEVDAAPVEPPTPEPPLPPQSRLSLWTSGAPSIVFALGPPMPTGLAAIGGQLDLDLRHRAGGLGSVAVRGAARSVAGFVTGRVRVSAGGGLGKRWGDVDLVAAVLVDAEPLWVSAADGRQSLRAPGGRASAAVLLLGGHARLGVAWVPKVAALSGDRWLRLRIGPRVEVGGSGLVSGGVARLRRVQDDGAVVDLVRAGGLELAAMLELGVGVQLRPRS